MRLLLPPRTVLVATLLAATAPLALAAAPDRPVAVPNAGFETAGAAALPSGWSLDGAIPAGALARRVDGGHGGGAAIELGADAPASLAVLSEKVALRVGHVYRLSAWVKTREAAADPLARYPTAVPATLSMASFPFTNHSPAVGGTRDWTRVETTFVATAATDRVRLDLGRNGTATGRAWFDDVTLAEVGDITEVIPLERVRWEGPAFRYEDRGWIFVHVEGAPYARGRQFGKLISDEIVAYIQKLSIRRDAKDPAHGWGGLRTLADALMLRRFDPEFLEEMKGIADGAAAAGAEVHGRKVDLVDVVTMNSAIDLDSMEGALPVTPSAITGRTFLSAEDELALPDRVHKCSSLTATGPATADGRPVFFQVFMWDGYTGVHFNVILDVVPEKGHRFVMQTFPGGIHSGTDFYMNDAGIVIGETTTLQTPFDAEGTPQSNRIRKAIQYGSSIDEVSAILREKNNGMYTNDWTLADVKRDEAAILLLGTAQSKLWRSTDQPAPFGTPGFLWANNNARDAVVRREVAAQPEDAPYDSTFSAWNRDLAFRRFYDEHKGRIDVQSAVQLMASSPINRPHACDGKVTDAQMAEKLVFMAHQGKVTLREKFPAAGSRRMPDLPGAVPHLTYGYATFSPIVIAEQLKAAHAAQAAAKPKAPTTTEAKAVADRYAFTRDDLWHGTFFPASDADNWLVAGSAAYWQVLRGLPEKADERPDALARQLGGFRSRLAYVTSREPDVAAAKGGVAYDRYAPALVPRVKGAFALHQLRLLSGNKAFFAFMKDFHARHRGQEVTTAQFLAAARESLGRDVEADLRPWLDRTGVPDPAPAVDGRPPGQGVARHGAGDAAGRGLPPRHDRRGGGRRQALPLPDDGGRPEGRGHVHRPGEAPAGGVRRTRRLPGGDRSPLRVLELRRGLREDADRLRHRASGRGEPHARPALPVGPGRRLLGDPAAGRPGRRGGRGPARRARPLRARRPAGQHAPRPRPAEGPRRDGAGHLPLPGSDLRRRAGRPLPRAAEPVRAGARAARAPRQQPARALRDDEDLPGRDCRRGPSSGARRSRRRGTSRSSASISR